MTTALYEIDIEKFAIIPRKFTLEPLDLETLIYHAEVSPNVYGAVTLWIGELFDDDGSISHGVHVACEQCPEEGSACLYAFAAPPPISHAEINYSNMQKSVEAIFNSTDDTDVKIKKLQMLTTNMAQLIARVNDTQKGA